MSTINATNALAEGLAGIAGPVRKIGVQTRSMTGTMPDGSRYESALERDLMLLLQFDLAVDVYTPQPLTISYVRSDGTHHRYTPDGLIQWRADIPVADRRPALVEVKYREAFAGCWREHRVVARAASEYAREHGWVFLILTEREIRGPKLENVRFLLPYRRRQPSPDVERWLLERIEDVAETTPRDLIESLYQDKWNQAALLPVLWKLLAERRVGFRIHSPLTMGSGIFSIRGVQL